MEPWFTVVIPTLNSAAWIGVLLEHYRERHVTPTILLDDKTTDETRAICERMGSPIVDIRGFSFTEAIVAVTRDCVRTPWVLFIHDDEAPSDKLFERLKGPPPPDEAQSVAVPRRWIWYDPDKPLQYGRSDHWQDRTEQSGTDHAWRIFRPDQVKFVPAMHSEGFYIDRWSRFPLDTYFVHFEWVLRTHAQRVAKLMRYDEYRYGYGKFFEKVYLPESQKEGIIEYRPVETQSYDKLAAAYFAARGTSSPLVRPSLKTRYAKTWKHLLNKVRPTDFAKEALDRKGLNVRLEKEVLDPYSAG